MKGNTICQLHMFTIGKKNPNASDSKEKDFPASLLHYISSHKIISVKYRKWKIINRNKLSLHTFYCRSHQSPYSDFPYANHWWTEFMTSPNQHLNLGTRSHQLPPLMNITTEIPFSLIQHPLFPLDYLTIPMNIQAYYIISHFKKKDSFKITPPSSSTFCSPPIFFFFWFPHKQNSLQVLSLLTVFDFFPYMLFCTFSSLALTPLLISNKTALIEVNREQHEATPILNFQSLFRLIY